MSSRNPLKSRYYSLSISFKNFYILKYSSPLCYVISLLLREMDKSLNRFGSFKFLLFNPSHILLIFSIKSDVSKKLSYIIFCWCYCFKCCNSCVRQYLSNILILWKLVVSIWFGLIFIIALIVVVIWSIWYVFVISDHDTNWLFIRNWSFVFIKLFLTLFSKWVTSKQLNIFWSPVTIITLL